MFASAEGVLQFCFPCGGNIQHVFRKRLSCFCLGLRDGHQRYTPPNLKLCSGACTEGSIYELMGMHYREFDRRLLWLVQPRKGESRAEPTTLSFAGSISAIDRSDPG